MKIAICIPTRNRPLLLISVLTAFDQLSSGKHEISYCIGVDEDDAHAYEAARLAAGHIPRISICFVPKDVVTIGGIWNYLAAGYKTAPEGEEPDIYLAHVDDALPIARYWDEMIVRYAQHHPAFSWFDAELGTQAGYPIITKRWLRECGYFQAEHFPFWFCDTWFEEVFQFTFNRKILIPSPLAVGGKRGTTTNLRDLDFWWGFFNSMRRVRLLEAHGLSKTFGVLGSGATYQEFIVSRSHWINEATKRDVSFRGERLRVIEEARQEQKEPSARYLEAKRRAEAYMTARGMGLWDCAPRIEERPLAAE